MFHLASLRSQNTTLFSGLWPQLDRVVQNSRNGLKPVPLDHTLD